MKADEETPLLRQNSPLMRQAPALAGTGIKSLVKDGITYSPWELVAWKSLFNAHCSIWASPTIWLMMLKLVGLTSLAVLLVCLMLVNPHKLKVSRFMEISKFLTVFVGLLLGFFVASSLARWHECILAFLELCDAIRDLQLQLCALDAPEELTDRCLRYGLLSGALLRAQLYVEEGARQQNEMWQELLGDDTENLGYQVKFTQKEFEIVKMIKHPAGLMWTWVASIVARMAQDGYIPPMASPTYGRIMNLAQDARDAIRHVRSLISVQVPFIYVHALASLVHINNIMNGICLGMVIGSVLSESMLRHLGRIVAEEGQHADRDIQLVSITSFICLIGPFLYQAIVEISLALAQPFASKYAELPIERLQTVLEEDLADGKMLAKNTPSWSKPSYRESVAKK